MTNEQKARKAVAKMQSVIAYMLIQRESAKLAWMARGHNPTLSLPALKQYEAVQGALLLVCDARDNAITSMQDSN